LVHQNLSTKLEVLTFQETATLMFTVTTTLRSHIATHIRSTKRNAFQQ